jgi:hypoxanthine phosphoribosyltransferase
MDSSIGRILIDRKAIAARVREMGRQLAEDLESELKKDSTFGPAPDDHDRIVLMPILTGAIVFVADLIREMPLKMSMRVVTVSSYPGATTVSKGAALRGAIPNDLGGRHVVVVDDILDSGHTLALVRELVLEQNPASLRIAVMLRKQVKRHAEVHPNYVGFDIPDKFVVGYGLDYDGYYRNLPEIAVLKAGE